MSIDPISAALDFGGKIIDRIWPDATEKQKAEASQIIAELAHEENIFGKEVEDRQSARDREAKIAIAADAPLINKIVTPILAVGVVALTFLLFGAVVFQNEVVDASRKDLAIYVLGALSSICGMVVSYYFGSSSGSTQKTDYMEKMLKK